MSANILISLSAQSRTCPWVSAGPLIGEDTVRYLELTPPVAISAFREMRGHLKQRRCGPFCSLPAFHQPGLLKRHTIIAGSAVGNPLQSMADKAEPMPIYGVGSLIEHRAFAKDPGSPPAGS